MQVGAIYRDQDPGRDSSLEEIIAPGTTMAWRTAQRAPQLH